MITVKNVNKYFDGFHALKDLSLNVNTGSIYGLRKNDDHQTSDRDIETGFGRNSI